MLQIIRHMFGEKNVAGITAIHHPLSDVDASASNIGLFIQIANLVNWATMDSHPDAKLWIILQRLGNFHCASNWRFRTVAKDQRTAVTGR